MSQSRFILQQLFGCHVLGMCLSTCTDSHDEVCCMATLYRTPMRPKPKSADSCELMRRTLTATFGAMHSMRGFSPTKPGRLQPRCNFDKSQ